MLTHHQASPTGTNASATKQRPPRLKWRETPLWNRFTPLQILVLTLASIAPIVIVVALGLGAAGLLDAHEVREAALGAGETPGMLVFAAMFSATPMQWWTGRSQVRVRKFLGIVFFLLAFSNGAMFVWESGYGRLFSRPLLIAGSLAVLAATPLFLTSSRLSQRVLGMRRWRLLHKLTYVVAVLLLVHVVLVGDVGPDSVLILLGLIARTPSGREWIHRRAELRTN